MTHNILAIVCGLSLALAACNPVQFNQPNGDPEDRSRPDPQPEEALKTPVVFKESVPRSEPIVVPVKNLPALPVAHAPVTSPPELPKDQVTPAPVLAPKPAMQPTPVTTAPVLAVPSSPLIAQPSPVVALRRPVRKNVPEKKVTPLPLSEPPLKTPMQFAQAPVTPLPEQTTRGDCSTGSRLLSCMACPTPRRTSTAPQFSRKGEALVEIMIRACVVRNASDPDGYAPPTRAQLVARMNRLSPSLYPDTRMSALQTATVDSLRSNPDALQKIFGGVFYSGVTEPTKGFETYFGISTIEARYSLCYAVDGENVVDRLGLSFTRSNSTPITSRDFSYCFHQHNPEQCRESEDYINANIYRDQLRRAMTESVVNPFVATTVASQQSCQWEKVEARMNDASIDRVNRWIAEGFTVGVETDRTCAEVRGPLMSFVDATANSPVTLAAYRCR